MEIHENEPPRKRRTGVGVVLVALSAALILGSLLLPKLQNAHAEGDQLQNQLILAYKESKSDFRICLEQSQEVHATDITTKDILMGLVSQFGPKTEVKQDEMTKYVTNSFPHLSRASAYRLGDAVVGCRNGFISDQTNNQRLAQDLDSRTNTVVVVPFLGGDLPNDQLVVVGPDGKKLHSSAALRFILEPER